MKRVVLLLSLVCLILGNSENASSEPFSSLKPSDSKALPAPKLNPRYAEVSISFCETTWAAIVSAHFVLQHFTELDTASGIGTPDGLIGSTDIQAAIEYLREGENTRAEEFARSALEMIAAMFSGLDTFSGIGQADGLVGTTDLEKFLEDITEGYQVCQSLYPFLRDPVIPGNRDDYL